jgi:hypothetical protein
MFPADGYVAFAWTYVDWVQEARNHLQANQLPVPEDLEKTMQHQLCLTLPPGWCLYDDPMRPRPTLSLSFSDLQKGIETFSNWIARGKEEVTQAEAERRALVCSRCYLNVNVSGCSGCQPLLTTILGLRKTKYDASLRSCAVCRCFLRAKVHFPISALDKVSAGVQEMYPGHCWLNRQSDNYRG